MKKCRVCKGDILMMSTPAPDICCEACDKLDKGEMSWKQWEDAVRHGQLNTPKTGSSVARTAGTQARISAIDRRLTDFDLRLTSPSSK